MLAVVAMSYEEEAEANEKVKQQSNCSHTKYLDLVKRLNLSSAEIDINEKSIKKIRKHDVVRLHFPNMVERRNCISSHFPKYEREKIETLCLQ